MNSAEPIITCPECKKEIKLTESLAAPILESTRQQYEKQLAQKDVDIIKREQTLREKEKKLIDEKTKFHEQIDKRVQEQLKEDRSKIVIEEQKKAQLAVATELDGKNQELKDLQEVLKSRNEKLAEAQKVQADLLRKQRELDDAKREIDLTVEKRIQEGLDKTRQQAKKEAEDELKLKITERDQTIGAMQKKIDDLKRKAEQGSQQLQGEVQELELESLLNTKFPFDSVEPVPKGEFGGDVLHKVSSGNGQFSGLILWESKRTRNWSDGWLAKLREDQRAAKAEIAVIVSQTLPKEVESFEMIDGIWVVHPRVTIPMATVLRQTLIELAAARQASEGQQTKTELIYQYLTGPRFRQRVEAIVEAFSTMRSDLEKERKAIMKHWAKREAQIENVMQATVGMYGDLEGIAGASLQEIEGLGLIALEASSDGPMDKFESVSSQ